MMSKNKVWLVAGALLFSVVCVSGVLAADFKVAKDQGSITVKEK